MRFLTQATLDAYVDKYANKQLILRMTEKAIKSRPWLPSEQEWQRFWRSYEYREGPCASGGGGRGDEDGIGGAGGALKIPGPPPPPAELPIRVGQALTQAVAAPVVNILYLRTKSSRVSHLARALCQHLR